MKQKIIDISTLNENKPEFLEQINRIIKKNPHMVNFRDPKESNQTFLHKLAYTEFTSYIAYFLEKKFNIYILDEDKYNILHSAVGCAFVSIIDDRRKSNVSHTYQIFRLFLNYEAEQRAYFPEEYPNLPWLKNQLDYRGRTPLGRAEKFDNSVAQEIVQELKKALKEQENYYQECSKANGLSLMPYHKQFLPKMAKEPELIQEKQAKPWSEKILEGPNSGLRHRSKSDEPIQKQQNTSMKPISRSTELDKPEEEQLLLNHNGRDDKSFVSRLMGWFMSSQDSSKAKEL